MNTALLCFSCIGKALILLIAANGAPVIAGKTAGARFACPVDSGLLLRDRRPLFGHAKTWRGLAAAVATTAAVAPLLGLPAATGAWYGLLAMAGDLLASFIKRRLGYTVSSRARMLDILPEALLPLLVFKSALGLGVLDIFAAAGSFFLLEALFSPLLFRLHIRNRPY
jgi:CDP-2,3-bis-(O-geranylgeranyl)-sn-glycerol synthase